MDGSDLERRERTPERWRTTAFRSLRTGFKLLVPLLITVVLLGFVVNFLSNALAPAISAANLASGGLVPLTILKLLVVCTLIALIFIVGYTAEYHDGNRRLAERFDRIMESVPGVGTIYSSSRKAGDILIDNNTDSFREVKLVEYPREGIFTIAFLTDDSPAKIAEATLGNSEDMQTVFVPFSPNPFMGGLLLHVAEEHLREVDMTVKEAATTIMTSGVTDGNDDKEPVSMDPSRTPGTTFKRSGTDFVPDERTK